MVLNRLGVRLGLRIALPDGILCVMALSLNSNTCAAIQVTRLASQSLAHLEATGRLELVLEESAGDSQFFGAVLQHLTVVEVAAQPHVTENSLFQLEVKHVELVVDTYTRELLLNPPNSRLEPVNVRLVPLHERNKTFQSDRRLALTRHARLHNCIVTDIHSLHLLVGCAQTRADAKSFL